MVNLEELRDLLRKERRMDELTELDDNFYPQVGSYIKDLENEIDKKQEENKKQMLRDERESAKRFIEKIFDRRIGKVIRLASLNTKGLSVKEKNMTIEEREIFTSLKDELKEGRKKVEQKIFPKETKDTQENNNTKEKLNKSEETFSVVRVLDNFPKFVGSNGRSHCLSKEDVVSLPKEDAKMLIKKGVAEKIEGDH
ncbi:hypothetical protein C9439_04710 [archaeon SCG-AAA382B04]|nr:hypothetical protein C9439_04710 [archaeon SCG-AAA382B04]